MEWADWLVATDGIGPPHSNECRRMRRIARNRRPSGMSGCMEKRLRHSGFFRTRVSDTSVRSTVVLIVVATCWPCP